MGHYILIVTAENAYWAIPSIFLSIISTPLPLDVISRIVLRSKYDDYMNCSSANFNYDEMKVIKIISYIVATLCLSFILLGIGYYTKFTEDGIYRNDYLSFSEVKYNYSDIDLIIKVLERKDSDGYYYKKPYYVITFKDGYVFSLIYKSIDTITFEKKYLNTISELSGKNVIIEDKR